MRLCRYSGTYQHPSRNETKTMHADIPRPDMTAPVAIAKDPHAVYIRRRVLIAAGGSGRRLLLQLFGDAALEGWTALVATSFEEARFVLQHDSCDVLLVDESLSGHDDWKDLSW